MIETFWTHIYNIILILRMKGSKMLAFWSVFTIIGFGAPIMWFALTNNPFFAILATIVGGAGFFALLAHGYQINSHKNYQDIEDKNREHLGMEKEISEREKLEDDLAFMCAIYNKIHVSYKECAERDAWLIVDKAERLGIDLNMNTVDALFYEKLKDSSMSSYLQRAMAHYTSLEYISIYG